MQKNITKENTLLPTIQSLLTRDLSPREIKKITNIEEINSSLPDEFKHQSCYILKTPQYVQQCASKNLSCLVELTYFGPRDKQGEGLVDRPIAGYINNQYVYYYHHGNTQGYYFKNENNEIDLSKTIKAQDLSDNHKDSVKFGTYQIRYTDKFQNPYVPELAYKQLQVNPNNVLNPFSQGKRIVKDILIEYIEEINPELKSYITDFTKMFNNPLQDISDYLEDTVDYPKQRELFDRLRNFPEDVKSGENTLLSDEEIDEIVQYFNYQQWPKSKPEAIKKYLIKCNKSIQITLFFDNMIDNLIKSNSNITEQLNNILKTYIRIEEYYHNKHIEVSRKDLYKATVQQSTRLLQSITQPTIQNINGD